MVDHILDLVALMLVESMVEVATLVYSGLGVIAEDKVGILLAETDMFEDAASLLAEAAAEADRTALDLGVDTSRVADLDTVGVAGVDVGMDVGEHVGEDGDADGAHSHDADLADDEDADEAVDTAADYDTADAVFAPVASHRHHAQQSLVHSTVSKLAQPPWEVPTIQFVVYEA
jgi:hypothetical protein